MNEFWASIILAVVQGIAEWFPISSSGHLVLASYILGYENTLAFDVALHFGTLMAVFVYFGRDISGIVRDLARLRFGSESGRMGIAVLIASLPAAFFGFLFHDFFERTLNDLMPLAFGFGITGLLLLISSLDFSLARHKEITPRVALLIGCAQVLSLFRGVSRSGSTMSGGVLLGLDQRTAARFSFLMSIPIIIGANLLSFGSSTLPPSYLVPALISFVVGLATIHVLLRYVLTTRKNLRWFGIYALLLAGALLSWLLVFD